MTKQSLEACVCVQKCGVRYHLATHYSRHKKQMNWKVSARFHHLFGKCRVDGSESSPILQSLYDSVSADFPNCIHCQSPSPHETTYQH